MIYLDNAATTPLDPEVIGAMHKVMTDYFGNPSSVHTFGREARVLIEDSRNLIAKTLNVSPSAIFFTSCATEGINTIMSSCVENNGVKRIITSPVEHHAVLHTAESLLHQKKCMVEKVKVDSKGHISLDHLETMLASGEPALVCLMHANNEIGNLLPLKDVAKLCSAHKALFLCDTVQTMGKFAIDLAGIDIDFAVCSAHKFHGPKGIGFLYAKDTSHIQPMLYGGGQERNVRSGTENIYGIVGMAKAFEVASRDLEKNMKHIRQLKSYMVQQLKDQIKDVVFNGDCQENGLYTILNVSFCSTPKTEVLLYNLDINGVAASGGSACSSGAVNVSHVLKAIKSAEDRIAVRFSFSKFNTEDDISKTIGILKKII